jgi:TetR/AcrR family transcriptional regulator
MTKVKIKPRSRDTSRGALLAAAKKLFARQGYDGVSVKEIAGEANLNVSLVSYYFKGKENLYHECLTKVGESKLTLAERVLRVPKSKQEFQIRLKLFLEEVMVSFLNDPESMRIAFRESDLNNPISIQVFRETYVKIVQIIVNFIKNGQVHGFVKESIDPMILSGILMSAVGRMVQFDHICSKVFGHTLQDSKHREKVIDHFLSLFSEGIFKSSIKTKGGKYDQ